MTIKFSSSLFVAETMSGVPSAVFWDMHTSLYNAGRPVTTITGAPGQGKTFGGQIITALSALMGKTTIVIDYKGDMLRVVPLKDELGVPVTIWNMADPKQRGILDPFTLANTPAEQLTMATEVINLFVGGLERSDRQAITPIIKDVLEAGGANMVKVVTALRSSQNEIARLVGSELEAIKSMEYANLCFYGGSQRRKPPKLVDGGLTIATLSGMDLPSTPEEARDSQTGRLASGLLFLLTDYIRRVLKSDEVDRPKTLIIDEAWAILSTPAGSRIVESVALLGRSKNLAMVLITQSPDHFKEVNIKNTVGTRFSFGASKEESQVLVDDMDLPKGEGFENLISGLPPYICMMSDYKKDYGLIKFSDWKKDWAKTFGTNPRDAMRERRRQRLAKEKALAAQ